jgi:hypothetical protein
MSAKKLQNARKKQNNPKASSGKGSLAIIASGLFLFIGLESAWGRMAVCAGLIVWYNRLERSYNFCINRKECGVIQDRMK